MCVCVTPKVTIFLQTSKLEAPVPVVMQLYDMIWLVPSPIIYWARLTFWKYNHPLVLSALKIWNNKIKGKYANPITYNKLYQSILF